MRGFRLFLWIGLVLMIGVTGCEKRPVGAPAEMHWDRDMCDRCKMAISERKFAVEIIDPQRNQTYKFDDIGCAVLWMDETAIPWRSKAIIWITDAKTGEWIDAKKAFYVPGAITPMAFGFAAYSAKTLPEGAKTVDFSAASETIREIEKQNSKKVKAF